MRVSQKLNNVSAPKIGSHRFEATLIFMSVVGFLSMASIYLLFI